VFTTAVSSPVAAFSEAAASMLAAGLLAAAKI
jgi:hypothetical protein